MSNDHDCPTLHYTVLERECRIQFGYLGGEQTALISQGDNTICVPRDVMMMAAKYGWDHDNNCPHCEKMSRKTAENGGKDESQDSSS